MKRLIFSILLSSITTLSFANTSALKKQHLAQVNSIENKLLSCIFEANVPGDCYESSSKSYDKLLTSIRAKYSSNVNTNLWQTISLNFANQAKFCRHDDMTGDAVFEFLPYAECKANNQHSLAITAIELHFK